MSLSQPGWLDDLRLEPGPPFSTMGTHSLDLDEWLIVDADRQADLAYKAHLLDTARELVVAHDDSRIDTRPGGAEVLALVRAWLSEHGIAYRFVDFKKTPPLREQLTGWCAEAGWQTLLNRRGTTWKKLDPEKQAAVKDAPAAIAMMLENPTAIRRPVMETDQGLIVGFDREEWERAFPDR